MGDGQWLKSGDEFFVIIIIIIIIVIIYILIFDFFFPLLNYYCVYHYCYNCLYYMLSVQHQSCKPNKYRNVLLQVIHFDPAFSGMQDLDGYIRCPTYGGWRQKDGVP